jgi:AcrR family transcriptional regulator
MAATGRVRVRRPGTPGPRGGGVFVSELQRTRLMDATFAVVGEQGYRRMTVRRVSGRAGVSNKTFYDLFSDREDCFLAAFDHAVDELAAVVLPAYRMEGEWSARVREGLGALLASLDREPALRALAFVEALGAGPRVLQRRAEVLGLLQSAIDGGRAGVKAGRELPPLTAEGVIGAAFGVIYARLIEQSPRPLIGLLGPLMAMIVLPYRGHAAAARELSRPTPEPVTALAPRGRLGRLVTRGGAEPEVTDFRLTARTQAVLSAVARNPGASNRRVADAAGVRDQGQISKLLARLEGLALLHNTGGQTLGLPNVWQITSKGENVIRVTAAPQEHQSSQITPSRVSR